METCGEPMMWLIGHPRQGTRDRSAIAVFRITEDGTRAFLPKQVLGMARGLLDVLTLGLPMLLRSDPGSEFAAKMVRPPCR